MPTRPIVQDFKASPYDILNAIRNGATASYQDRVPEATQETLKQIGLAVTSYTAIQNEFLDALVNRIARVIITSKSYTNPLREFKKGILEYGETVEEVFVNVAKAHPFDPETAEKEVYKREIPDVQAIFHRLNYQNFFKATISDDQLRQAFLSAQGITDLIANIVDQMYTGSELDEFIIMKQLISEAVTKGMMYPIVIPTPDATTAKAIVSKIKAVSNKMEFMNSTYNAMGVLTYSKKESQVILMDAEFDAIIDVEVLASAFNLSKVEFMGRRVLLDNFGSLTGVTCAIVDKDWFMVFDNLIKFTEKYNTEGLYWNYWYHVWKTFSVSPFSQAVIFTTDPVSVTNVTITPKTATMSVGQTKAFTALVTGVGYVEKTVQYSISEVTDSKISYDGKLTVGKNETATTITVTATSSFDSTKKDTATVTIA